MNARANVCASIRAVQPGHNANENIVATDVCEIQSQIVTVWPDCVDGQTNGHSDKEKRGIAVKLFGIDQEEICTDDENVGKPYKIRNDEQFHERNIVIGEDVDDGVIFGYRLFQPVEPRHIDK